MGPGDKDVTHVEHLAGFDDKLLADDGLATAEGWRDVLDAIGCSGDQRGKGKPALRVGLKVDAVIDRVELRDGGFIRKKGTIASEVPPA